MLSTNFFSQQFRTYNNGGHWLIDLPVCQWIFLLLLLLSLLSHLRYKQNIYLRKKRKQKKNACTHLKGMKSEWNRLVRRWKCKFQTIKLHTLEREGKIWTASAKEESSQSPILNCYYFLTIAQQPVGSTALSVRRAGLLWAQGALCVRRCGIIEWNSVWKGRVFKSTNNHFCCHLTTGWNTFGLTIKMYLHVRFNQATKKLPENAINNFSQSAT